MADVHVHERAERGPDQDKDFARCDNRSVKKLKIEIFGIYK